MPATPTPSPRAPLPCSDAIDLSCTDERTIVDLAGRGMAPLMALGHYRYLRAHDPLPPMRHCSLVVLALPTRGPFTFEVDGHPLEVGPGRVLCVPPGSAYVTGTTAQARGELTWLIARKPAGSAESAETADSPGSDDEASALGRVVSLLARPPEALVWEASKEAMADLRRAFLLADGPRGWIADARLRHVVSAVLFDLATTMTSAHAPDPVHRDITRTLAWIDAHLSEAADATDLATVAGLSTSQFYEAFRDATGTSPKDYLLRRKTDRARAWLESDASVTVTEVAHALGFSSSQYFATVFRRYQHCAPSACRP